MWPGSNASSRGSSSSWGQELMAKGSAWVRLPFRRLALKPGGKPMSGSPLAPRSTAGNFCPGRFSAAFGSISSDSAARPLGLPTTKRAWMIGSGAPFSSTACGGRPARIALSSPPGTPINWLRREGAHEFERLLFRFRGDRHKHREGHTPRRGDRKSPSDTRTTHTRSQRPCLEFTCPASPLNKKRTMRTDSFIGA